MYFLTTKNNFYIVFGSVYLSWQGSCTFKGERELNHFVKSYFPCATWLNAWKCLSGEGREIYKSLSLLIYFRWEWYTISVSRKIIDHWSFDHWSLINDHEGEKNRQILILEKATYSHNLIYLPFESKSRSNFGLVQYTCNSIQS